MRSPIFWDICHPRPLTLGFLSWLLSLGLKAFWEMPHPCQELSSFPSANLSPCPRSDVRWGSKAQGRGPRKVMGCWREMGWYFPSLHQPDLVSCKFYCDRFILYEEGLSRMTLWAPHLSRLSDISCVDDHTATMFLFSCLSFILVFILL